MFPADRIFFPIAAAFGMIAPLLWVAALSGWLIAPGVYWHAHEMLFGYALLVIAGYLVGRAKRNVLALLLLAWLAGRIAPWVAGADSVYAALPQLAFSFTVAALTAWPFLRAAKKLQNRVFGPVFIAFFLCDAAYEAGALMHDAALQAGAVSSAIDVYALLLVMMGGRVIPAAIAGHYYRQGRVLQDRVQPALETAVIALLVAMIVLDLFPATRPFAGACAIGAAAVTAVRAYRWRLWTVLDEPHLWSLGLGYAWLVPGLAWKGYALWSGGAAPGVAQHALAIGALGTITLVMMARTRLQRSKLSLARFGNVAAAAVLLSGAAIARLCVPAVTPSALPLLWLSAGLWAAAFVLLLLHLLAAARPGRAVYSARQNEVHTRRELEMKMASTPLSRRESPSGEKS
jgi:uncharacterized protein involved in response to NO